MPKPYTHLTLAERIYIQSQLEMGFRPAAIAAGLKRSPSSISRELRRNGFSGRSRLLVKRISLNACICLCGAARAMGDARGAQRPGCTPGNFARKRVRSGGPFSRADPLPENHGWQYSDGYWYPPP